MLCSTASTVSVAAHRSRVRCVGDRRRCCWCCVVGGRKCTPRLNGCVKSCALESPRGGRRLPSSSSYGGDAYGLYATAGCGAFFFLGVRTGSGAPPGVYPALGKNPYRACAWSI